MQETNKFVWMPDNITGTEKIISALIWAIYFYLRFQLYQMLDIVPSCRNLVQYFEPNFVPNVLPLLLGIVPSYHPIHFKGKLTTLTRENGEKSDFRPNFDTLGPNFPPSLVFFEGFISTSSQALSQAIILCKFCVTDEPNFRKWQKILIWAQFLPVDFTSATSYILFQGIILRNLKEHR